MIELNFAAIWTINVMYGDCVDMHIVQKMDNRYRS